MKHHQYPNKIVIKVHTLNWFKVVKPSCNNSENVPDNEQSSTDVTEDTLENNVAEIDTNQSYKNDVTEENDDSENKVNQEEKSMNSNDDLTAKMIKEINQIKHENIELKEQLERFKIIMSKMNMEIIKLRQK